MIVTTLPVATLRRAPHWLRRYPIGACVRHRAEAIGCDYVPPTEGVRHLCDCTGGWVCSEPPEER